MSAIPDTVVLMGYKAPYQWPALLTFLADRAIEGVETVDDLTYRRTIRISDDDADSVGWMTLSADPVEPALRLCLSPSLAPHVSAVRARVAHLTDIGSDPAVVGAALGEVADGAPGLRVPGAIDGFELAVRAILGQQITVKAARTLAGRFAAAFGQRIQAPGLRTVFPRPQDVGRRRLSSVASLGVVAARAQAIIDIAKLLSSGQLMLAPTAGLQSTLDTLRSVRGVGEWTAQYIAMRALGWRDAFPHADLALLKALGGVTPKDALAMSEAWRPWRAYAAMHLWHALRTARA